MPEEYGPLEAGTYVTSDPFFVRVTFTVPDRWEGNVGGEYFAGVNPVGRPGGVNFLGVGKADADPCHFDQGFKDPAIGPSVDDFAVELANDSGLVDKFPTKINLSGYSGRQLFMTAPASFEGCTLSPDGFAVWQLPLGANYSMLAGQTSRLLILDVDGSRLVIDIPQLPGQTAKERAEAQALVDSIRIAPVN
jgi:hypothetical protein